MAIANYVFAVIMILVALSVVLITRTYPSGGYSEGFGPAFYPLILSGFIVLLSLVLIIETLKKKDRRPFNLSFNQVRIALALTIMLIIYSFLIQYLGFLISTVLFLFVAMITLKTEFKKALITSVILTTVVYVLFKVILQVPVPEAVFI